MNATTGPLHPSLLVLLVMNRVLGTTPAQFQKSIKGGLGSRKMVLAWSPDDTLVDEPEVDGMTPKLERDDVPVTVIKSMKGAHDFVWEDGRQAAQLVEEVLLDPQRD
ncbi:hypothetical protein EDB81DRAFT_874860 [Dactylonectria macrodidyma]|uniref:Uncharacterized protein n=1 Tax=Dactylonectria macrodidyma TaxID=307937 RepID=A0A9P9FS00_9HYPO|nr:hypothetical protein EDB81DRAFT_874860 [Dactylonectria macrodidyma]